MKKIFVCLVLAVATAAMAVAADVTGKWSGTFVPENGEGQPAMLIAAQAGTAVTGTAGPNEDQQWPIKTGKIEGNKVSLEVVPAEGVLYKLDLVLDGDSLKGDFTATRGDMTMKAKIEMSRVK